MVTPFRFVGWSWLLVSLATLAGCGSDAMPTVPVSGRVTLDGQPLTAGVVYFVPQAGPAASGKLGSDGSYYLSTRADGDGAVAGAHQVYIADPPSNLENYSYDDYVADVDLPPPTNESKIPAKYRSMTTSELTAKVESGSSTFDFELTTQ